MIPLKEDQLGTIKGKKGYTYKLTPEDILWAGRAVCYEGGWDPADVLWCMAQRYVHIGKGYRESDYQHFYKLLRAYSQPINPIWTSTGWKCKKGGPFHNKWQCEEERLDRRDEAQSISWDELYAKKKNKARLDTVLQWAQGNVANTCVGAVHFAAPDESAGFLENRKNARLVKKAGNWFIAIAGSRSWENDAVIIVGPDGSSSLDASPPAEGNTGTGGTSGTTPPDNKPVNGIAAVATPLPAGSELDWSEQCASDWYNHTERDFTGGYFPIGSNGIWHGGVHIHAAKGSMIHATMAGHVVAVRLGPNNFDNYGSSNFILLRHELSGRELSGLQPDENSAGSFEAEKRYPLYSLYMHLNTDPVDSANPALKKIGWLYKIDTTEGLAGSVGKKGDNATADVELVQELLGKIGKYTGMIDGDCGPLTKKAIYSFQSGFSKKPDSRVDPGGKTWNNLLAALDEKSDGNVDSELLERIADGGIVALDKPVDAGEAIWTSGYSGDESAPEDLIHWEIFSPENLFPSLPLSEDLDDDYSLDCPSILSQVGQDGDLFEWEKNSIVDEAEVEKFYSSNTKAMEMRTMVCRFHNGWAVNPDTALSKFEDIFETEGIADALRPYMWWNDALSAGVELPDDPKVYHYNPITLLSACAGFLADNPEEESDYDDSAAQDDYPPEEEPSEEDATGEENDADGTDDTGSPEPIPDVGDDYSDNNDDTPDSDAPDDDATDSFPNKNKPFEEINQGNPNSMFYCWRWEKGKKVRRTTGRSACCAVSIINILNHYDFQKDLSHREKISRLVKFMRGPKKAQQYDGESIPPKVIPTYDYISGTADPRTEKLFGALKEYTGNKFEPYWIELNEKPYRRKLLKDLGVEVMDGTIETVREIVEKGGKLMFSTNGGVQGGLDAQGREVKGKPGKGYMPGGHFVVVSGIDTEGYFTIADPAGDGKPVRGWGDLARIKPEKLASRNFFGIKPAGNVV